jgi:hypothetical protein
MNHDEQMQKIMVIHGLLILTQMMHLMALMLMKKTIYA